MPCIRDLLWKRYAVKKFTGELLPKEKVLAVLEAARLSPSTFNLQPTRVIWVRGEKARALASLSYNQENIATASDVFVFSTIIDKDVLLEENFSFWEKTVGKDRAEKRKEFFQNLFSTISQDEFECWMKKQTYISLGFALLSAIDEGLGSCPIGGFDPEGYKKHFSLPDYFYPTVVMALGVPADTPREKLRIPMDRFLITPTQEEII